MKNPPLNLKTNYSLLKSMIKVDDLVLLAKNEGLTSLAIADENLYGAYEFYKKCTLNNIKPVIGISLNYNGLDLLLFAKNNEGYKNLIKINAYGKLENYTNDIICIFLNKKNNEVASLFEDVYYFKSKSLNEVRTLNESDIKLLPILESIKKGITVELVTKNSSYDYFETNDDEKVKEIIEKCNVTMEKQKDTIPVVFNNSYEELKTKCIEGMKKRFGNSVSVAYKNRLKKELEIISSMGFENYFLIVSDYVAYAKSKNILVGPGRGSAPASLVSYVLYITDVDPIKYDLLFERFLNPSRKNLPDIDIDFEFDKREQVINYCVNKYGKEKVSGIITFGTLSAKQVLRDVCRSFSIEGKTTDYLVKFVDSKKTLFENLKGNEKLKKYLSNDAELTNIYNIAMKLEGLKKHKSIHAAGIVMSDKNLDDIIPIDVYDDINISGFNMNDLEELGLLKMDLLGLKNLSLIKNTLEDINEEVEFSKINLNDNKTFSLFKNAQTNGVFQFETDGMMNFLSRLQPSSFSDLCAAIALFRPGPIKNIDSYIRRKNGLDKVDYFHEDLKGVLEETYGIIIYQEQIMKIANIMAGYDYGNADVLRRAMAKKDMKLLESAKDDFVSSSIRKGYDEKIAIKIYNHILKFADYGFNKAHSVSYSLISYKMAYLKANYPKEFFKNILNYSISSDEKVKVFLYEARNLGVDVLMPSINDSYDKFTIEGDAIRCPITLVKGLSSQFVSKIVNNHPYNSVFDLFIKCDLNKKDLDNISKLAKSGLLDSFVKTRKTLINNIDEILNFVEIYEEGITSEPELTYYEEYTKEELMSMELETYGMYISEHPVSKYKTNKFVDLCDVKRFFDKNIDVLVLVDNVKTITTKNGNEMTFLTGSDESAAIDLVLFPKIHEKFTVSKNDIIKVNAKVEKRFDKYQLILINLDKVK